MGFYKYTIEQILQMEGVENISPLDTLKVNATSKTVAEKLCKAFPNNGLNYKDLFIEISRLNMYSATMPDNLDQAKYYYRNSSIYFNKNVDFNNLDGFAIHECIHYLQSVKDSNGDLYRLGLCNFKKFKQPGLALNEAAVQLITAKCMETEPDTVKYYGIDIQTPSPSYYPLECAIVNQMAFIAGIGTLFDSTLFSNNNFKNKFSSLTSRYTYDTVELNIDYLMKLEENLSYLSSCLESDIPDFKVQKINDEIAKTKEKIVTVFMGVQNFIYTAYFNNYFNVLKTTEDVKNFKNALIKYRELIGTTEGNADFDEYYITAMTMADKKAEELANPSLELTTTNNGFISTLFKKIRAFITGSALTVDQFTNVN